MDYGLGQPHQGATLPLALETLMTVHSRSFLVCGQHAGFEEPWAHIQARDLGLFVGFDQLGSVKVRAGFLSSLQQMLPVLGHAWLGLTFPEQDLRNKTRGKLDNLVGDRQPLPGRLDSLRWVLGFYDGRRKSIPKS